MAVGSASGSALTEVLNDFLAYFDSVGGLLELNVVDFIREHLYFPGEVSALLFITPRHQYYCSNQWCQQPAASTMYQHQQQQ